MGKVMTTLEPRTLELGPEPEPGTRRGRHWRLTRDGAGVAWLILDEADRRVNTVSESVLAELGEMLRELEQAPPTGVILRSAKPPGFAAGGDISAFAGATDRHAVEQRLRQAHDVVDRLEALRAPTVAVIHGHCLGGGLELALACRRRIAVIGARLGFPEVRLGLHPGLGGPGRATRRIDPTEAMTLMLTGKTIDAPRAAALGLVDAVTEERHIRAAATAAIEDRLPRATGGGRGLHALKGALLNRAPARRLAAGRMRSKTAEHATKEHYPAPYALIELWERHGGTRKTIQAAEITSFARLLSGDTAQNLIRVFELRESLKRLAGPAEALRHVHVVGAGTMGRDIAGWCALQGLRVTVSDLDLDAIGATVAGLARLCERKGLDGADARRVLDRLTPDPRAAGAGRADVVIEAVPERVDLKRRILADLEPRLKAGALIATNTSSIPLEELGAGLDDPSRLVGLHFFNPVARMQVVEVVGHDRAADPALAAARAFVGRIDRLPVPVRSAPGFLINRVLTPYLLEAILMVTDGVPPELVDRVAMRFGMPVGPVELADRIGLDVCREVADLLRERLDARLARVPRSLVDMVDRGDLGRKTGRGFYDWTDGDPKKATTAEPSPQRTAGMTDRLLLPLLDACVACLHEGVVESEDLLDGAMIFATGFAPFRGGPMRYLRHRGVDSVTTRLAELAGLHGDRFRPHPGWARFPAAS